MDNLALPSINIEIETQSTDFKTNNVGRYWRSCMYNEAEVFVKRNRFRVSEGSFGVVERVD